MKHINPAILPLVALIVVINCLNFLPTSDADELQWDELKFTQEWGFSACRQFKDKNFEKEKKCRFEGIPSIWSVHGIWPTKQGSQGPNFCKKVTFDVNALSPIMNDLNKLWYEIDDTKDAHRFWEHEWLKHGSCAMELDIFGTELKYFGEGIALRNKLDIYSILKSGGIIPTPTQGYRLDDIHNAFQQALGSDTAVPYVQCLRTTNEEANVVEYHMLAIEICLDKDLQILDCRSRSRTFGDRDAEAMYIQDQAGPCPAEGAQILYTDYNFQRGSQIKTYHRMKPFFAKNIPMSTKFWNKLQAHRSSRNEIKMQQ